MLIMQKDLLAELHLNNLDFKSIQNVVQNSARLAYLLKESSEYVQKIQTVQPHFKVVKSMVSDCTEINPSLSMSRENIKTVKRKFILGKSSISNSNSFKNGLKRSGSLLSSGITTGVSNALQQNSKNNTDKYKCQKICSFPKKCFSESEIVSCIAKLDTSVVTVSNSSSETESLKGVISSPFPEDKPLNKNSNECTVFDSLLVNSHYNILRRATSSSHTEGATEPEIVEDVIKHIQPNYNFEIEPEPAFCVISEVIGNANDAFSEADDSQGNAEEAQETQLIVPKKTNDITKIKGWRRKQFFVEKPTTIEFYSLAKGSLSLKKKIQLNNYDDTNQKKDSEDSNNVENAFVCDSLDEFLDRDAELKIGFEIPHLFAEFGIKLTSEEIVSRPNLSEKDIREVETRYCMPVPLQDDITNLDEIKEENIKRIKRPIEDDTKSCKILKIEDSNRHSIRLAQKSTDPLGAESNEKFAESKTLPENFEKSELNETLSNIKLANKLIALVVYPGPFMPLHPIVQYHLAKIRNYRTKVDKNWANFAASALLVNHNHYKRYILPVQCCVKIKTSPTETSNSDDFSCLTSKIENDIGSKKEEIENKSSKGQFKLKKCSVVIEKLNSVQICDPWCMEHNCYDCAQCGLDKAKFKKFELQELKRKVKNQNEELRETFIVSPRASFDKKIATLLAKKVRLLKYNGDTLTSIDCLKTLTPNIVEFIKLKFIKESLLTGYINIWYLKPQKPEVRSRAFLTFSKTSPVPNAINLRSSAAFSLNNLPKVITEIISKENTFDSNDYAILHCNGEIWEIHGSLNIAFGKNDKNVEQVFTSVELPELKKLQKIAFDILHVKAVKWWVLDLTQKFRLIEFKSGYLNTVVVRKKFIETIAMNSFGFLPLRRDSDNRVLGAYIIQRLLPFVLIGPYYLLETHDLTLKGESSTVPFTYYGEKNVTSNYPLKFFINSVIKNLEQNEKKLEGLWLYDKMNLDSTSYLEVVTTASEVPLPNKYSSIDIEHGYSLSSLTSSSTSGATSGIIKRYFGGVNNPVPLANVILLENTVLVFYRKSYIRCLISTALLNCYQKDGKEEFKQVTVYLYFDIFDLGFVEGELQFDNSVIISHPLDRRTKMKSHKIGDWFIGIIKRRIEFIPKNLLVRWFITKHKDDLRDRRPFNKFFLGGAHILTKKGVYYLLEMSESKIEKLGLSKSEISKAITESEVINEVKELKNLADLFLNDSSKSLSMEEVLSKAVNEIEEQKKLEKILESKMISAEKEKVNLTFYFLNELTLSRIPFHIKMKMIESIEFLLKKKNGNLSDDFVEKLKASRVGRSYLKRFENDRNCLKKKTDKTNLNMTDAKEKNESKFRKYPGSFIPLQKASIQSLKKSSVKLLNNCSTAKANRQKYPELHLQIEKLNSISDRYSNFKNIYAKIIKNPSSGKGRVKENFRKKKIKNTAFIIQNSSNNNITGKKDRFVNLKSSETPKNIKLYWKNWSSNKLEVA